MILWWTSFDMFLVGCFWLKKLLSLKMIPPILLWPLTVWLSFYRQTSTNVKVIVPETKNFHLLDDSDGSKSWYDLTSKSFLNPSFVFVIWLIYEASSVSGIGLSVALSFWYSGCSCVFCPSPSVITSPNLCLVTLFPLDGALALMEMGLTISTISSYVFCGGLSPSTFGYSYPVKNITNYILFTTSPIYNVWIYIMKDVGPILWKMGVQRPEISNNFVSILSNIHEYQIWYSILEENPGIETSL